MLLPRPERGPSPLAHALCFPLYSLCHQAMTGSRGSGRHHGSREPGLGLVTKAALPPDTPICVSSERRRGKARPCTQSDKAHLPLPSLSRGLRLGLRVSAGLGAASHSVPLLPGPEPFVLPFLESGAVTSRGFVPGLRIQHEQGGSAWSWGQLEGRRRPVTAQDL